MKPKIDSDVFFWCMTHREKIIQRVLPTKHEEQVTDQRNLVLKSQDYAQGKSELHHPQGKPPGSIQA
jgi:hypothetical protein